MKELLAKAAGIAFGGITAIGLLAGLILLPYFLWLLTRVLLKREWLPWGYLMLSSVRRWRSLVPSVVGMSMVAFVLAGALMLADGIRTTLSRTEGDPLEVKVLRKNIPTEMSSFISAEQVQQLLTASNFAQRDNGTPVVSPEIVSLVWANLKGSSDPDAGANVTVRGFRPDGFAHLPPQSEAQDRRLDGRMFTPGSEELVIGKALQGRFEGAEVGGTLRFAEREWKVVGVLSHAGSAFDSEVWGSDETLRAAFKRPYSSVAGILRTKGDIDALNAFLLANKELNALEAVWAVDYWRSRAGDFIQFVVVLGVVIGLVFSFGAILGAMNTMYSHVQSRSRELATLRAVGFKSRAVLVSIVVEAVWLGVVSAGIGLSFAAALTLTKFRLTNPKTLSELAYQFHLGPGTVGIVLGTLALMGYFGGLLPAFRAANRPIPEGVRAD